jgi:hypothetical protein
MCPVRSVTYVSGRSTQRFHSSFFPNPRKSVPFFEKRRSRFSGRISLALQTGELSSFFKGAIRVRHQDQKPARLQV